MNLQQLVIVGILVEALGESIWWVFDGAWNKEKLLALGLGLGLAGLTGTDLFAFIGLPLADYLPAVVGQVAGIVAAGLIGMRGATAVHDLLGLIRLNLEKLQGS